MNTMSKIALRDELKLRYLNPLVEHLTNCGEEVLRVGSNEVAIPCVDAQGNDSWIVVTVKCPTGSRDGDAYDGYAMAEDYAMKQQAKAEKAAAEKAAKAKARKAKKNEKAAK